MAELQNSPPSAHEARATGPVFHKNVEKVKVTSGGVLKAADFKGKTYERDGEVVSASSLGWDHADLVAAEANPSIVIERFDKNGRLVKKDGTPYPSVSDLTPKPIKMKED